MNKINKASIFVFRKEKKNTFPSSRSNPFFDFTFYQRTGVSISQSKQQPHLKFSECRYLLRPKYRCRRPKTRVQKQKQRAEIENEI